MLLRRRASDPPSLSSLQTPDREFMMDSESDQTNERLDSDTLLAVRFAETAVDVKLLLLLLFISGGSEETSSRKQWEDCAVSRNV